MASVPYVFSGTFLMSYPGKTSGLYFAQALAEILYARLLCFSRNKADKNCDVDLVYPPAWRNRLH